MLKHTLNLEIEPELKGLEAYQNRLDAEVEPAMAAATCLVKKVSGPKHLQDTVPLRLCLCRNKEFLAQLLEEVKYEPPKPEDDETAVVPAPAAIATTQTGPPSRTAPSKAEQEAAVKAAKANEADDEDTTPAPSRPVKKKPY